MTKRTAFFASLVLALAFFGLWFLPTLDRKGGIEPVNPDPVPVPVSAVAGLALESPRIGAPAGDRIVLESSGPPATIEGVVLLPGDAPCPSGFVFAWHDGLVPTAQSFRSLVEAKAIAEMAFATIQPDGSFRLVGLQPDKGYTLSAVAPGAACIERPVAVRPGATQVTLRLMFTYGVAIRLVERGGLPLRTAQGLFGGGPRASGPVEKLQENPRELWALEINGLEQGHGTRDRWQYLAVAENETTAVGPIGYEVEVPGYVLKKEVVYAPRLVDRLQETVVELDPRAVSWGEIDVRVLGQSQVLVLGLAEGELIGVARLSEGGKDPTEFAVHARALSAPERISGIPEGSYAVHFEARDAIYQTEPEELVVGPGRNVLAFDCSDAGSLLIDVEEGGQAYHKRFVAKVVDESGAHFYVTYDRGPYVIPALFPGAYRVTELAAPGRKCLSSLVGEIEVFAGQVSVDLVTCRPDGGIGAR